MLNHTKKSLFFILLMMSAAFVQAQQGKIRGQVIEDANGEPLFSANAVIKGTTNGTTTDFDGNFEINAEAGTYNLEVSFIGLSTVTITGIVVKPGEVTVIDVIRLKPSSSELDEVVITAEAAKNTEAAIITVKKKSANVIDGISAAKLRKTGDSDAGDAAKRVTGVSVEGGKYVYVRGLGDRYTKTMLNGVDIPGLDPDRNSIQIDIFPTTLMENMTILKTATADLPADFTGGVVNIETQEFPTKKIFNVSLAVEYNPSMHFNSEYIDYEGGSTDFLGFDDGTRKIPNRSGFGPRPPFNSREDVGAFTQKFNRTLGATEQTSLANYNFGVTLGNQYTLKSGNKIGYIFSGTYKNNTIFYDDIEFGEYQRSEGEGVYDMIPANDQRGIQGEEVVLLGGLAGVTYKTLKSKYKLNVLHLQNGEKLSGQYRIINDDSAPGQSGYQALSHNLEYNQRGLTNVLLSGEHYIDGGTWELEWKLSPTLSKISDPDIRKTAFTIQADDLVFSAGQGGNPSRIWRYLDEVNAVGKIDLSNKHTLMSRDAKLKFGVSHVYKRREFEIIRYNLRQNIGNYIYDGDPNTVLNDSTLFPIGELYYNSEFLDASSVNPNRYDANVQYSAAYVSEEFNPISKLKAIVGVRVELYSQYYSGKDQVSGIVLNDKQVLNDVDLFPSANLIYSLNDNQNIRAAYFGSIARPSFKELSFATILDPVSNRTFNGGLFVYGDDWDGNLVSTRIQNFDLGWELYMKPGEIISVSTFYKQFTDPIEIVRIPDAPNGNDFQPRNVGNGMLYGVEFQVTKSMEFVMPSLKNFTFSGNLTLVESSIDMTDAEYNARKAAEKAGQTVERTREMAGQAPYIVNAGFSYDHIESGWSSGVFYNVKGRTLEFVGGEAIPDVYAEQFHSLNFTLNKTFGKDGRSKINLKVTNILNDRRESFFRAYEASPEIFTGYSPGVAFSVGYSFNFL